MTAMINAVFSYTEAPLFIFYMNEILMQQRVRDYERFMENRRFEEMTDIAERLGYPIDTTIQYEMRDGAAYALSDTVDRPFHSQTWLALQRGIGRFTGDQAFEAERLRLEHEEALQVDAFGRGELAGNVLIKFSKVPDAVASGQTSIKGYRRDLLRSFVRVYTKMNERVECRLFTLDHNSAAGMQAVGRLVALDLSAPSEEVLAESALFAVTEAESFASSLIEQIKRAYDEAQFLETGQRSHAGSRYIDKQDAMSEIKAQSWLIDEHMQSIADIVRLGRGEPVLEDARKRVAAAIKLASQGALVSSAADGAVAREVATGDYGRECPTEAGMNQANQANSENVWRQGECVVCFTKTKVGSCNVCARCEAADNAGVDLLKLRDKNIATRKRQQKLATASFERSGVTKPRTPNKVVRHRKRYGAHISERRRIVVGGAVAELYDRRTNEVLPV